MIRFKALCAVLSLLLLSFASSAMAGNKTVATTFYDFLTNPLRKMRQQPSRLPPWMSGKALVITPVKRAIELLCDWDTQWAFVQC